MTEQQANQRLIKYHDIYFKPNLEIDRYTRYAAVIKDEDDYKIEIAYSTGETNIEAPNFNNLDKSRQEQIIKDLLLPTEVYKQINKKEVKPILVDEIFFQNTTNSEYHKNEIPYCKFEKLTGGISVFNAQYYDSFGTAGAFFKTKNDCCTFLLSNYHVLVGENTNTNLNVTHPSISDVSKCKINETAIGKVFWQKKLFENKVNFIDAALVKINPDTLIHYGKFTKCDNIKFISTSKAKINQQAKKCGRTTGFTKGKIKSINCTINISNEKNELYIFKNQILIDKISEKGDSGSVLVDEDNNVIGLLFGGNNIDISVANHIDSIINAIKNDIPEFEILQFL